MLPISVRTSVRCLEVRLGFWVLLMYSLLYLLWVRYSGTGSMALVMARAISSSLYFMFGSASCVSFERVWQSWLLAYS